MRYLILTIAMIFTSIGHADDTRQVLVVSGLQREGNIAAGPNVLSVLSGDSTTLLNQRLSEIDPSTIRAVVSFGVAGGITKELRVGDVVISTEVIDINRNAVYPTDPVLTAQITETLKRHHQHPKNGPMAVAGVTLMMAADKTALGEKTGAISDDNESAEAGYYATIHHLPFVVIRTISDPVNFSLPPAASSAINSDGSYDIGAVFDSLFKDPFQLPALIEMGVDASAAFNRLQRCRYLIDLGSL